MEFDRLELLIGHEKLEMLKSKTILVLGIGGVGGYVVEGLVRSSIGRLILVDFDKVDITNINRQIIATYDNIGKKKVDCFKERINKINDKCLVSTYDIFYTEEYNHLIFENNIDFIVDCCDSVDSKVSIIKEACKRCSCIY